MRARQTTTCRAEGAEAHGLHADAGYAMAVLLVALAVMAVLATAVMPVWRHQAKREREEELIFRGTQYARSVALFQRKFPGAFPPNVDALVSQKFLRRKYKDPMTSDGEFQLVYQNSPGVATAPGAQTGRLPGGAATQPAPPPQPLGGTNLAGPQGGLVGVVSRSKEQSIKIFNGRTQYNEWQFDYTLVTRTVGAPGAPGTPGSATPGQPVGPNTPGSGRPGSATPGLGGIGPGGVGPGGGGPGGGGPGQMPGGVPNPGGGSQGGQPGLPRR